MPTKTICPTMITGSSHANAKISGIHAQYIDYLLSAKMIYVTYATSCNVIKAQYFRTKLTAEIGFVIYPSDYIFLSIN